MQIDSLVKRLREVGITDKQARVYIAGLLLGPSTVQTIAEQAGVNRPTAYVILDELSKMGLVKQSLQKKRTLFSAAPVSALEELLDRQQEKLDYRRKKLGQLKSDLFAVERSTSTTAPVVRFVKGKEGIDAIISYAMRKTKPGTEIYSLTNHDEVLKLYPDLVQTNPKKRLKKQLSSKQFYYNSKEDIPSDPKILKETKKLTVAIPAGITLFEDKALFFSYDKQEDNWGGIIIESKEIVSTLRHLFSMAWSNKE